METYILLIAQWNYLYMTARKSEILQSLKTFLLKKNIFPVNEKGLWLLYPIVPIEIM